MGVYYLCVFLVIIAYIAWILDERQKAKNRFEERLKRVPLKVKIFNGVRLRCLWLISVIKEAFCKHDFSNFRVQRKGDTYDWVGDLVPNYKYTYWCSKCGKTKTGYYIHPGEKIKQ
jgi:hypothetical protein